MDIHYMPIISDNASHLYYSTNVEYHIPFEFSRERKEELPNQCPRRSLAQSVLTACPIRSALLSLLPLRLVFLSQASLRNVRYDRFLQ
jgi:hypothetical protein